MENFNEKFLIDLEIDSSKTKKNEKKTENFKLKKRLNTLSASFGNKKRTNLDLILKFNKQFENKTSLTCESNFATSRN